MSPLFPEITVNGVAIAPTAIAAEAQNQPAPPDKPGIAWRKAARALVIREAMLQEARRAGLAASPHELAPHRRETEDEALIRSLMEERIDPVPVTEAAIRAAYDAAPERFRTPDLWQVSHILYAAKPEDDTARAEARAQAAAALRRLAEAPDAFGRIAGQESDCPSRTAGGQLGQIAPGDTVPEFEAALAGLAEGQIISVETRYGVHVLRVDAHAGGTIRPFDLDTVRAEIAEALEKAAWAQAARDFVADLLERTRVTGLDPARHIL